MLTPDLLTRALIDRERARGAGESDSEAAVVRSACEHLCEHLSLWMGVGGSHALFTRALLGARGAHPALATIQVRAAPEARLDGVEAAEREAGPAATAGALQELLEATISLLGRFVGEDMVASLVGLGGSGRDPEDAETHRETSS